MLAECECLGIPSTAELEQNKNEENDIRVAQSKVDPGIVEARPDSFARLLRQLGLEHDREVTQLRLEIARLTAGDDLSSIVMHPIPKAVDSQVAHAKVICQTQTIEPASDGSADSRQAFFGLLTSDVEPVFADSYFGQEDGNQVLQERDALDSDWSHGLDLEATGCAHSDPARESECGSDESQYSSGRESQFERLASNNDRGSVHSKLSADLQKEMPDLQTQWDTVDAGSVHSRYSSSDASSMAFQCVEMSQRRHSAQSSSSHGWSSFGDQPLQSPSVEYHPLQGWRHFIMHAKKGANDGCVRLGHKWYQMSLIGDKSEMLSTAIARSISSAFAPVGSGASSYNTDATWNAATSWLPLGSWMSLSGKHSSWKKCLRHACRSFSERSMLHPNSWIRVVWDLLGITLLMHDFVMIPMQVFESGTTGLGESYMDFWLSLDFCALIFWTCDVAVSFRTGFYSDEGFLEVSHWKVARHYLKTWFLQDTIVNAVDWTGYLLNFGREVGYLRLGKVLSRVLRIVRLLRFMRLGDRFKQVMDTINSEYLLTLVGVLKLLFGIIMVNHYIACTWYALSQMNTKKSWDMYFLREEDFGFAYVTSLHWSLTQFTPASMEVHPTNTYERIYAVVVIIAAMVTFSSFVSSITGAMTHLREMNSKRAQQDAGFRQFFSSNKISQELARMIWHFRRHNFAVQKSRMKEADLPALKSLPAHLQDMIRFEVHFPVLHRHPVFALYAEVCPDGISKICSSAVTERQVLSREELKDLTGRAHTMLFVRHGILKYFDLVVEDDDIERALSILSKLMSSRSRDLSNSRSSPPSPSMQLKRSMSFSQRDSDKQHVIDIESGHWACEVALWSETGRTQGWFSGGDSGCDLTCVDAREFQTIVLQEGGTGAHLIAKYAKYFVKRWNVACADPEHMDVLFNCMEIVEEILDHTTTEIIREQQALGHRRSMTLVKELRGRSSITSRSSISSIASNVVLKMVVKR